MAEVKWIKITTNMFEDEKIDFIESLPEADAILVMWIKLLTLAGKINANGYIFLTENIPYNAEMLAHKFKRPLNTVKFALETLKKLEMVDFEDEKLKISNWEKHQSTEKMARINSQNTVRQQRYYYRTKLRELGMNVDEEGFTEDVEELKKMYESIEKPNVRLTLANETEVRSKKLEVRSKKKESNKDILSSSDEHDPIPYSEIVSYLNQKAERNYKHSTSKTKSLINARWNEGFSLDDFKKVIDNKVLEWKSNAEMSNYLRPETLFGTKFESYLNQKPKDQAGGQRYGGIF